MPISNKLVMFSHTNLQLLQLSHLATKHKIDDIKDEAVNYVTNYFRPFAANASSSLTI